MKFVGSKKLVVIIIPLTFVTRNFNFSFFTNFGFIFLFQNFVNHYWILRVLHKLAVTHMHTLRKKCTDNFCLSVDYSCFSEPMHIRESNWQKSRFILSGNVSISIFSWSPNKLYHTLLGSQIITVVKSCHQSERQRTNQKDKEPIVYKMNSARIKYKLLAWVGGL